MTNAQVSILIVSKDSTLSHTRALVLKQWHTVVVSPEVAPDAIAASAWRLLIICQTIPGGTAAGLVERFTSLHPSAKVMAINRVGEMRSFRSVEMQVDIAHPRWLPDAVARVLSAESP
jgi:hypothetical protein